MTGTNTGTHILAVLKDCPADVLQSADVLKRILNEVVLEAKLNKVGEVFHQFDPVGATGVVIIAESHISAHTWPEKGTIALDVFTCGKEGNAHEAYDLLFKKFCAKDADKIVGNR